MFYPKVFIIILNWNGLQDTLACLESVRALSYPNYETVVVDNGSVDSPVGAITDAYPEVTVILNGENLGYSGGNNAGIRYALGEQADYIWLLNNDTVVEAEALTALVTEAEEAPDIGIAGSKIYYFDCPKKIWFAGSHIDWWRGFTGHDGMGMMDLGQYDSIREVDRVTGCSMLVKREVCERVGILDESFFLYVEEVDWCVRARKAGFKCVYVPSSIVHHKISASASKAGIWDTVFAYYNTRNFLYLIKKSFYFPIREIILLKVILLKLKTDKMSVLKALVLLLNNFNKLEPNKYPNLFAIKDFILNRSGKVVYKL